MAVKAVKITNIESAKEGKENPRLPKQQLCFRLNWEWEGSKRVSISTQTSKSLAPFNIDSPDQLGTMVPLLFSPFYSQFSFPPQQDLKDFRNLKELKRRMNFSRIRKQNRGLQGFCEEGKKVNLGIPKANAHQSASAPQEEHLAAREPGRLLPAHQDPPGQSRGEPRTATHRVPACSLCSPAFSECVPPFAGVEISAL